LGLDLSALLKLISLDHYLFRTTKKLVARALNEIENGSKEQSIKQLAEIMLLETLLNEELKNIYCPCE